MQVIRYYIRFFKYFNQIGICKFFLGVLIVLDEFFVVNGKIRLVYYKVKVDKFY